MWLVSLNSILPVSQDVKHPKYPEHEKHHGKSIYRLWLRRAVRHETSLYLILGRIAGSAHCVVNFKKLSPSLHIHMLLCTLTLFHWEKWRSISLKIWKSGIFVFYIEKRQLRGESTQPLQALFLSRASSNTLHCHTFSTYFYVIEPPISSFQSVWEINAVILI